MHIRLALAAVVAASMAAAAPAAPAPSPNSKASKKICKEEPPPVGSRLGAKKVCATEEEWRARERSTEDMRMHIERHQMQRPALAKDGG